MKFRKILALVLAVLTVLTLATAALADEPYEIRIVIPGILDNTQNLNAGAIVSLPNYDKDGTYVEYWSVIEKPEDGVPIRDQLQPGSQYEVKCDADLIAKLTNGYTVNVIGSSAEDDGSGRYRTGDRVEIDAGSKSGYRFVGWTTEDRIELDDMYAASTDFAMPAANVTVTANWEEEFRVTVSDSGFGSVTPSTRWAIPGEKVYLDISAPFGFVLGSLTVTTRDGHEVKVKRADGDYYFVMPDEPVEVDASFVPVVIPSFSADYDDVADTDWYADAVDYVTRNELMDGTGDGQFSPNVTTTRAMLVTILYRLDGAYVDGVSAFTDVPAGTWYTNAVAWANDLGLVTGYGDGTFGPDDPVTREQMAAILQRYAALLGYDVTLRADLSAYRDASSISAYAADAMAWANAEGLINGVGNDRLNPKGDATRAEVAAILQRFCENIMF